MSEDMEKIIERIRKCLELSKCADEGEAAAAILAARRLMEKYGITEQAVEVAGIGEVRTKSTAKKKPALWESNLAEVVAVAFDCRCLFVSYLWGSSDRAFVGTKAAAEIAAYSFAVLLRRAKAARSEHLRKLRRYSRAARIRRADVFCYAWVQAVEKKVGAFAAASNVQTAIDAWIERKYHHVAELESNDRIGKEISASDVQSYYAGMEAGADVTLRHGVKAGAEQGLLA